VLNKVLIRVESGLFLEPVVVVDAIGVGMIMNVILSGTTLMAVAVDLVPREEEELEVLSLDLIPDKEYFVINKLCIK
jgi:hypothetical protein